MYPKCMTICGSFEILFLQHFFIWSYKAVIDLKQKEDWDTRRIIQTRI